MPSVEEQSLTGSEAAFEYCSRMAKEHYENFPVGSFLIPQHLRKHVYAIYAFARTADDFADEGYDTNTTVAERLALLDDWESQLHQAYEGKAANEVFAALSQTVKELDLPKQLFLDLLSAFKQDVTKTRYRTFDEVLDYCRRSANPVGRLILLLFGYRDEERHRLSDHICTALQLANFWQDVAVDVDKDRMYLPLADLAAYGVTEAQVFSKTFDQNFARLLRYQVDRTRAIFLDGKALPSRVKGRLKYELRLTWLGGMRILAKIEQQNYDTLGRRPVIGTGDKLYLAMRTILG